MKLEKINHRTVIIGLVGVVGVILAIYLGITVFFIERFYPGSTINCINVSGKTVTEADNGILDETKNYKLDINGRNGFEEFIKGDDINLVYNSNNNAIKNFKDSQNPFKWFYSAFINNDYKSSDIVSFDDDELKSIIEKFSCFDITTLEEPKSPILQYENGKYTILKETYGNKVDKEKLHESIVSAIESGNETLDMEKAECYAKPRFTSESPEIIEAKDILDKYVSSKITYKMNGSDEILDGDKIKEFLDVDKDYQVNVNEKKVKEYVISLAEKYNTVGKTRKFKSASGNVLSISGGDYGRRIDISEEVNYIVDAVKEGKTDDREPKYSQAPFYNGDADDDIGSTYVEVNLSGQHLWFFKNGQLIIDSPIVSGNISNGHGTPGGVYKLDYKERNATLKGEGYSSPVSFWMPFNGGIGIHDATWRSSFGGNIYLYGGSHGCVNAPYSVANTIFNNIEEGTPIVCYY